MKFLTTASSYQKYSEAHLQCETKFYKYYFIMLVSFYSVMGFHWPLLIWNEVQPLETSSNWNLKQHDSWLLAIISFTDH